MQKYDRTVYEENTITFDENGEVKTTSNTQVIRAAKEPEYIKLYLDCVMVFKGLKKGLSPILIELTKYMSYADIGEIYGGQVIFMNKSLKELIARNLNVSVKRIEQALTHFVKSGIIRRIATSTYQMNPNIFGKGEWTNIKNIRAMFNFENNDVTAEIIKDTAAEYIDETTTA